MDQGFQPWPHEDLSKPLPVLLDTYLNLHWVLSILHVQPSTPQPYWFCTDRLVHPPNTHHPYTSYCWELLGKRIIRHFFWQGTVQQLTAKAFFFFLFVQLLIISSGTSLLHLSTVSLLETNKPKWTLLRLSFKDPPYPQCDWNSAEVASFPSFKYE